MLDGATSKARLPHCWQRGAGGRYQQVLTTPKKRPLEALCPAAGLGQQSGQGGRPHPVPHHTGKLLALSLLAPGSYRLTHGSSIPEKMETCSRGTSQKDNNCLSLQRGPRGGAGAYMWHLATTTCVPFALPSCACPVSPSSYFIALF